MPAAAVIPAPIAYIKVAAVKKLVVDPRHVWPVSGRNPPCPGAGVAACVGARGALRWVARGSRILYLEKIGVFKAGWCSNVSAWNNKTGRASLFCWFLGKAVMINRDGRGLKYSTVRSEIRGTVGG